MELFKDRQNMVNDMLKQYEDILDWYEKITTTCNKTLMSKNRKASLYGMFLPDEYINYCIPKYQGRLTTDAKKLDYKYYFDDNDRIVLTERYSDGEVSEYIFYFYKEDYIDIILYSLPRSEISIVGKIEYRGNKIYRFFETYTLLSFAFGFKEFTFLFEEDRLELRKETRAMISGGTLDSSSRTDVINNIYRT